MNNVLKIVLRKLRKIESSFIDRQMSDMFRIWYEVPVAPIHYYSPLPAIPALKKTLARWHRESSMQGIDISQEMQQAFLDELRPYQQECELLPNYARLMEDGFGQGYGEVESHFLHCAIRFLKPRRVMEIGSGVSTYFTFNALRMNQQTTGITSALTCIEPYPTSKLLEWAAGKSIRFIEKEVQDVPLETFTELKENDILFIDSSHVSKIDSDVNYLYLEVLPFLKKGVAIHIHDIPFPYLALMPEHRLFDHSLLWNEPVIVRSFLMFNDAFKILACQSYLHFKCPEALKSLIRIYDNKKHFPASLWIRKIR